MYRNDSIFAFFSRIQTHFVDFWWKLNTDEFRFKEYMFQKVQDTQLKKENHAWDNSAKTRLS